MYPYTYYKYPSIPNFNPPRSAAYIVRPNVFEYIIYKKTLQLYPKSHSLHFTLQPAIFMLQVILGQLHRMTPNDLKNLQSKVNGIPTCIPVYIHLTIPPESQISILFTLQPPVFKLEAIERSALNGPK